MKLLELLIQMRNIPIKLMTARTEQEAAFESALSLVIEKTSDEEAFTNLGFNPEHALVQAIISCSCSFDPKKVSSYLIRALDTEDSNGDFAKGE